MSEQSPPPGHWVRPNQPPLKSPPAINAPAAVLGVIGLLAAIHGALWFGGENWQRWALFALALIPVRFTDPGFAMIPGSQYWSLFTYMLLHADWMHLLFNCLWLLIFGTPAARYLGTSRFLALCVISGLVGGLCSLALHWGQEIIIIGASGAVSGLLGAAMPLIYGRSVAGGARPLTLGELIRNPRALMFTGVWLALTLFSGAAGWTGNSFVSEGGIAWEAHIGGFLAGLLCFSWMAPRTVRTA
ncbi:rhomboid family intramembrane serine protease [Aestuariivirga sp.]|uniref:rhomboid family intramembrane serine protease n=1 Tax=Aestuariivirga sp. TaxID=2650926 RepID=UPI003BAAF8A0